MSTTNFAQKAFRTLTLHCSLLQRLCFTGITLFGLIATAAAQTFLSASDEKELLRGFDSANLKRNPAAAGAMYCPKSMCNLAKPLRTDYDPAEAGVALSYYDVTLKKGSLTYRVFCDDGGSADMRCSFGPLEAVRQKPDDFEVYSIHIDGELFIMPGDGCLYSFQGVNTDYRKTRKFCENGATLVEVKQAFEYKGLRTTTNRMLRLTAEPRRMRPFHTVSKGRFIEVLVGTSEKHESGLSNWYLVRDAFGMTGWIEASDLAADGYSVFCAGGPQAVDKLCVSGD